MEGDIRAGIPDAQDSTISIHSLRMEGDPAIDPSN